MQLNKRILTFVIFSALSAHVAFLLYLHKHPITLRSSFTHTLSFMNPETFQLLKKRERTEILGQIFDQISEAVYTVKEELRELKAEFSPSPSIAFPEGRPLLLAHAEPSFAKELSYKGEEMSYFWPEESAPPALFSGAPPPFMMQEESASVAASDHFTMHVEYGQRKDRPGYLFKAIISPSSEFPFKRIQQNYFFLIDRSNSIPRARFMLNKDAVSYALDHLKPYDTFNILLFDHKVIKLSETPLMWNAANVAKARDFLQMHGHGGYFAATELYSSLGKIIPDDVTDSKVNTAILLSDGDSYLPQEQQRRFIGGWTRSNMGKVTLYAVASGGGNNLPLLELLSSFNKGALVYSYDHTQLGDKLVELLRSIRNPIAKDMVATGISSDRQAVISLQPKNGRLGDLYQNRPYVVYGSVNKMSDITLFLQGNYYGQRLDIKKQISFDKAKVASPALEKAWTLLLAQDFYERYFEDGNKKHLEAARRLLEPMHIQAPLTK